MPPGKAEEAYIAFTCNQHGIIMDILDNQLQDTTWAETGRVFALSVDRRSMDKARNFVQTIQSQGSALDWELNVPTRTSITTLHFSGGMIGDHFLVVGAKSGATALVRYGELMHTHGQRDSSKFDQQAALSHSHFERDTELYNELSRLNNELVTLQRELAKKNVQLERLNALKNQFLGMAAHDLRTPLSAILSYTEFLLDEAADILNSEHVEFLSIIQKSSHFMLQLVSELLDVSTIASGKLVLDLYPTDLVALTQHNVALNSVLAQKKGIQLTFQHQGDIPKLLIDQAKIEQVLNNLISNAVHYSQPNSTVDIRLYQQETQVILSVKDEGPGIPPDEVEKLFKLFGRTSVRSTDGEKSTGLGLAICRRIVLEHQGEIWVESQVNQGSTFYVALPTPAI